MLVALPPADALPQVEDALEVVVDQNLRGDGAAVAGGAVDQKVLVFVSRDFLPAGLQLLERDQYGVLQVSAAGGNGDVVSSLHCGGQWGRCFIAALGKAQSYVKN